MNSNEQNTQNGNPVPIIAGLLRQVIQLIESDKDKPAGIETVLELGGTITLSLINEVYAIRCALERIAVAHEGAHLPDRFEDTIDS